MLSPRFVRLGRQCLVRTSVVLRTHHELRVNPYRASLSRIYATPPPQTRENNQVSVQQYHQIADDVMDRLVEQLEQMIEDSGVPEYEVDYSAGVLTLKLDNYGTYVINKQPPNKQIWMSSPFSGPFRYDYDSKDGSWRYLRDGHSLIELLNRELAQAFREPVKLSLE